jgi:hypothetical protein
MPNCQVFPPAYVDQAGCDVEPGSVVAVAFIDEDVSFTDITDPAEWANLTYSTDILVHQEVRGSYAKPAATEIPGKGKQDTRVVGRKHELAFKVSSIKGNDNYWNTLNRSTNYTLAFVVGSDYDLLLRVDKNVSIDAGPVVQEGLDTEVDWEVSVKWSDIDVPSTSDVPAGIFE